MAQVKENIVKRLLNFTALSALFGLFLIALFILKEGLPFIFRVGLKDFLFSSEWDPDHQKFGISSMAIASIYITIGAMLTGGPLGVAGAIFLTEFMPKSVMRVIKPIIELLAGIPSVVFGFIGLVVLVPFIREHIGGSGYSLLGGSIILGIMILPTIISISTDAIAAVPNSYREGSLALGATRWQTIRMVVLKSAKSGIIAGVILGMGRAIGETMAVIMLTGNSVRIPHSAADSMRTLTANIALETKYATGLHRQALFATGVVLFVIIMILNSIASAAIRHKAVKK